MSGEPSRIARVNERIYVTLRATRAVVELADQDGMLVEVNRATVGTEPLGIVAAADGAHVYVALSTRNEVVELSAELVVERTFSIAGHPSWLALHPNGDVLYVASQLGGSLRAVDLRHQVPTPIDVPFPEVIGAGREAEQGDPSVYYDSIGLGLSPNNPTVALFGLGAEGLPDGGLDLLYAVGLAPDGDSGEDHIVRSFLSNVSFSPEGDTVYGCMEGSESVVALATDPAGFSIAYGDFIATPSTWIGTDAGPRGIAFVGDETPFVYNFIGRSVGPLGQPALVVVNPTLNAEVDLGRALYYSAVNPQMSTSASGAATTGTISTVWRRSTRPCLWAWPRRRLTSTTDPQRRSATSSTPPARARWGTRRC